MAKFLDENGVKKLWSRIQEYVYECCCSKGGGGDVGYECKDGYETLWKGVIETYDDDGDWASKNLEGQVLDAEKIRVIFQGTAYDFKRSIIDTDKYTNYAYGEFTSEGDPILKNAPIAILSGKVKNDTTHKANSSGMLKYISYDNFITIYTRIEGLYKVEVQTPSIVVETTECFQKAVKSVGDSGYECTTSFEKAFSESGATTKVSDDSPAQYALNYTDYIDADEIKVVFNGIEYTCPKTVSGRYAVYGSAELSFTDYPFALAFSESRGKTLFTKDPMDFDITVFDGEATATVTPCFEKAVRLANTPFIVHLSKSVGEANCTDKVFTYTDKTFKEISEAFFTGRTVLFQDPNYGMISVIGIHHLNNTVTICVQIEGNAKTFRFNTMDNGKMQYPNCLA